jgi:serine/threonine-protein kinase
VAANGDDPADIPTVIPTPGSADTMGHFSSGGAPPVVAAEGDGLELSGPRYAQKGLLGRGGMGEVFLCSDAVIGRQVAMKQILRGVDGEPDAHRRFLREARIQGQLEHPAIVPVYELSRGEDGRTYFTMKRVKGESLLEVLQRQRRGDVRDSDTRRRLLNAFARVCLAVDFAHERGVIHRDLKPANIMLGDYGEVYVLDWGLAKIEGAAELDDVALPSSGDDQTEAGAVYGTPGYAAPEQLKSEVTRSIDIYALGAVLFELLSLQRLHTGNTIAERLTSTVEGANARISARAPDRDVPPELEALCIHATAYKPEDRPASARELHDALMAFLDGDRDLELRRAAAAEHAARARDEGARALEGDDDARGRALHAVGRALGLDPGNREAMTSLVDLLEHPPRTLPAEVQADLDEGAQRHLRLAARDGALGYVSWFFYVPLLLAIGVRDAFSLGISTGLMTLAAGVSWWASRRDRYLRSYSLLVMVAGTLALSSMTRLFGPFVLLPTILMGQAVAFSLSPYRRERYVAAGMSTLGIVGPVILEAAGMIPAQTVFTAESMTVLPGMTALGPVFTPLVLSVASLALIVTPVLVIGRARDSWSAAEEENAVRAWHLRRLIGDDAE